MIPRQDAFQDLDQTAEPTRALLLSLGVATGAPGGLYL